MNDSKRTIEVGGKPTAKRPQVAVADISRRNPVTVRPETSIKVTLQLMAEQRIGSVIVTDPGSGVPVGIFTLRDVLCRVAMPQIDIDRPIDAVMTPNPVSVGSSLAVAQAAREMARLGLRHLLITDQDRALTGIVSRSDIYEWLCDSCTSIRKGRSAAGSRSSRSADRGTGQESS